MKTKISLRLAIIGILLVGAGFCIMVYPNLMKKPKTSTTPTLNEENMLGDSLTTEEISSYQQNIANLKNNLQSYEFQHVYPEDATSDNMITETLSEAKKTELIGFLEAVTPVENLPSELGWSPYTEVIHIMYNQTNVMSIYPCAESFCFVINRENNKMDGFVFNIEKDIYELVKEEQLIE